jgi:hypothetical protein
VVKGREAVEAVEGRETAEGRERVEGREMAGVGVGDEIREAHGPANANMSTVAMKTAMQTRDQAL